jgi:hypothetical protein
MSQESQSICQSWPLLAQDQVIRYFQKKKELSQKFITPNVPIKYATRKTNRYSWC